MERVDWHEELARWHHGASAASLERVKPLFGASIAALDMGPVVSVSAERSVHEALKVMREAQVDCALVREGEAQILGIVKQSWLERNIREKNIDPRYERVTRLMDTRGFSIEAEATPILDVLEKLVKKHITVAIIVDRLARPIGIVSPRRMLNALAEFVPGEVTFM